VITDVELHSFNPFGPDNDSDRRQRDAIAAFAKRAGYVLEGEFNDAAVSGVNPIEARWHRDGTKRETRSGPVLACKAD